MRINDFRSTLKEIIDANQHGQIPKDKKDLDSSSYGLYSKMEDQTSKANDSIVTPIINFH